MRCCRAPLRRGPACLGIRLFTLLIADGRGWRRLVVTFGRSRLRSDTLMRLFALTTIALISLASGCSQQKTPDLALALKGISKSSFLQCSGPPMLEIPQSGQDRMSFVSNLTRGQPIGIASPTALPVESCSGDAVFEEGRLVQVTFSGDQPMCSLVFAPCLNQ
jgi:hypothetical protein